MTTGHASVWQQDRPDPAAGVPFDELVVCSLKAWDEVWNRNNFLADALLRRNPTLRVLFVEPPTDPLYDLTRRHVPRVPALRRISADSRLWALRPLKVLPRRMGPLPDALLRLQVVLACRRLRLRRPVLWVNDVTYAPLIERAEWPSVYDVSDDWLLAPFSSREIERLRVLDRVALERADEVVVCSTALAQSRGKERSVHLVPNAVDVEHFRRPRERPADLPAAPVAVYAGTLHDARIDVPLVLEVARRLPSVTFAFVGPDSLSSESREDLNAMPNICLLGSRPYDVLPGYLQHADAIVVPHLVSPFMESLDPIKAYECLAVSTPTVATPVPGFRELEGVAAIAGRQDFPAAVEQAMAAGRQPRRAGESSSQEPPSWDERAASFEVALALAAAKAS